MHAMFTRAITLAATSLIACSALIAQPGRFEAGIQLGPSLGWLRGNKAIDATDPILGPSAMATLRYAFSEHLGVSAGLGYQGKGMLEEITLTDINGNLLRQINSRYTLDYLMIPLMLRASFGNKARLTVGVGPYAGLLLRSQQSFGDEENFPTVENTDDLEQWDMGISASLGGAFPLSEVLSLQAEVRYDKGLTNISAVPVVDDGSIRTNAVCLMLGCSYRFGGTL